LSHRIETRLIAQSITFQGRSRIGCLRRLRESLHVLDSTPSNCTITLILSRTPRGSAGCFSLPRRAFPLRAPPGASTGMRGWWVLAARPLFLARSATALPDDDTGERVLYRLVHVEAEASAFMVKYSIR